jgi:biopolymer transport protein ExbD
MNFRRMPQRDRPEINLVALIDVLLVVMIFLMASTTFQRYGALSLRLPDAASSAPKPSACTVPVAIGAEGNLRIAQQAVAGDAGAVAAALSAAAHGDAECQIDVQADALATHQSVVRVMEAARLAGLPALVFSTLSSATE